MGVAGSKDSGASSPSPAERAGPRPPAGPDAAAGTAQPGAGELDTALGKINQSMSDKGRGLVFSIDPDSKRTIVKIIDQNTQEVLRQIPTKEALDIAKDLEAAQGLLIKHTA
jgi:flagellar protein FlaG